MLIAFAKWAAVALALSAVVAFAAALTGHKVFRAELTIAAPPEAVWAVLMDTEAYAQWNVVFVEVQGDYAEGKTLVQKVREPNGTLHTMKARVKTLRPGAELRQTGGALGILTFDHSWRLTPVANGTRVVQEDVNRGIAMWFWDSGWVEPAYAAANQALAQRVQALAAQPRR